jgi:hypothetical protein
MPARKLHASISRVFNPVNIKIQNRKWKQMESKLWNPKDQGRSEIGGHRGTPADNQGRHLEWLNRARKAMEIEARAIQDAAGRPKETLLQVPVDPWAFGKSSCPD